MSSTDLAVPDFATEVERAADPGEFVVQACERAKVWLREALDHGGIDDIVELKAQADAIRVYTMSKQLGKDAELAAQEIVRRAERGLALAIRKSQEAGDMPRKGQHRALHGEKSTAASDYFSGGQDQFESFAMAEGVTEEQFEEAIQEAKAEGNVSRRNVARKTTAKREAAAAKAAAQDEPAPLDVPAPDDRSGDASLRRRAAVRRLAAEGYTSKQIAEKVGRRDDVVRQVAREMGVEIPADKAIGRSGRAIDPNRVVRETVHAMEGLAMGLGLIIDDLSGVDRVEAAAWGKSLRESSRFVTRLIKGLKEIEQ